MSLGEGAHWSSPLPTLSSLLCTPRAGLLPLQILKQRQPASPFGGWGMGLGAEEGVLDLGAEL